jgi:hypothetical protein
MCIDRCPERIVRTMEKITGREDLPLSPRWRRTRLRIESPDGKLWTERTYTIDGVVVSGEEWANRKRWVVWPVVGCGPGEWGWVLRKGGERGSVEGERW